VGGHEAKRKIVLDSSVLLHGVAFPFTDCGYLLQRCSEGQFNVILCPQIVAEAEKVLSEKNPRLMPRLREMLHNINPQIEAVDEQTLARGKELAAHPEDAYVIAVAVQTGAEICSLDTDFFSEKVKAAGVRVVWPCDVIWDLSVRYVLKPYQGTIVIMFSPRWSSELQLASKRFYVLDFKDIFGLYYEFPKKRFKLEPYVLPGKQGLTSRLPVAEGSWYYIIVRYAANRGFRMLLVTEEGKRYDKSLRQEWPACVTESVLYVGSDANGSNQINGLIRFYVHSEWLSDSDVDVLRREWTLSLSMRHLDLASSPFGTTKA
jgi:predicted nucleic acid-binding protein